MKKLLTSILLLLPIMVSADETGQCGDNVYYTYVEATHTMTFTGTGMMAGYDWEFFPSPWHAYENDITTVIIEEGVTSIGTGVFEFCGGLTSITIPKSVTSIGPYAFLGCGALTSIEIPENVTTIDWQAFSFCRALKSINIPKSVTSIGDWAFNGCNGLTCITVESGNSVYDSRDNSNSIIETATNTLIVGCSNTIIPENVTSIGPYAFYECSGLKSINIPNSVTSIGSSAFSGCRGLTSINFSENLTSINESAFNSCSGLTSINIPKSVTSIGNHPFAHCWGLTCVTVESGNSIYDSRDNSNSIIESATNTLIVGCSNTIIPESVTSIGPCAFYGSSGLTSINIPNSVTSIGSSAFYGCSGLTSITSYIENPFAIDKGVFHTDIFSKASLYVPSFALEAYTNTEGWKEFQNILSIGSEIYVNMTLQVKNDTGEDVTDNVSITWYNDAKEQIGVGNSLGGVEKEATVYYSVELDDELGRIFREVNYHKAIAEGKTLTCELEKIPIVTLSGQVLAIGIEAALADVSITQKLNGKYVQTVLTKTDANGWFTVKAADDVTEIIVQYAGYTDYQLTRDRLGTGDLGTLYLEQVKGTVLTISLSYQEAVIQGEQPNVQNWYSDARNIQYTLYNITKGLAIENFAMQQGDIVVPIGIEPGDRISVKAHSLNGRFADTTAEVLINNEATGGVNLLLKAFGGVYVNYSQKHDEQLLAMLYDECGQIVASNTFSNYNTTFGQLAAGSYQLVTMGYDGGVSSVTTLDDLSLLGLTEGVDYVLNQVTVSDGAVSQLYVAIVPERDASKFEYTSATSYLPSRTQMTAGMLITMTARVDFLPQYIEQMSDVKLVVNIPDNCTFIDNSVCVGTRTKPYTFEGKRLIIPLATDETDSRVRFCLLPTQSGTYTSTALAEFNFKGERIQTIGTAVFEAIGEAIFTPLVTPVKNISVSGISAPKAEVAIYDGGHLIGTTTAKTDGTWHTECELHNAYNLSTHGIYAQYRSPYQQTMIKTAIAECLYDINSIIPNSVTMIVFNPEFERNEEIVFDFEKGTSYPNSYYYFPYKYENSWTEWRIKREQESKDFTFVANLIANNNTTVSGVTFYVHTTQKEVRKLTGFFDEKQSRWVAISKFDSNNLPINVSLDVERNAEVSTSLADIQKSTDTYQEIDDFVSSVIDENRHLNELDMQISEVLKNGDYNYDYVIQLLKSYEGAEVNSIEDETLELLSDDDFIAYLEELSNELDASSQNNEYDEMVNAVANHERLGINNETFDDDGFIIKTVSIPEDMSVESLLNNGYRQVPTVQGQVLEKIAENEYDYIDFVNNIRIHYTVVQNNTSTRMTRAPGWIETGNIILRYANTALDNILTDADKLAKLYSKFNADRQMRLDKILKLEKSYNKSLTKLNKQLETAIGMKQIMLGGQRNDVLEKMNKLEKLKAKMTKLPRSVAKINRALFELDELSKLIRRIVKYNNQIAKLQVAECTREQNPQAAEIIDNKISEIRKDFKDYAIWKCSLYAVSKIGDVVLGKLPLIGWALNCLEDAAVSVRDEQFDRFTANDILLAEKWIADTQKRCKKVDEEPDMVSGQNDNQEVPEPTTKPVTPIHDPSGFVYEAVPSNRIEGVKATIYEQNASTTEWDAEEYSQVNPQVTDETGLYRWDVPMGNWQVRFEKEGYETTQTEWLPVPPPQLEINIPMTQGIAPEVVKAHGTESGITLTFNKYMRPTTIEESGRVTATIDTPSLLRSEEQKAKVGNEVKGGVETEDLEEDPYTCNSYASKVKFVFDATTPLIAGDVVLLTVKKEVESYCGVKMTTDQTLRVVIEPEIKGIVCDSLIAVDYMGTEVLEVTALPAEASKGKKVYVESTSPMIASIDKQEVTLDDEGKAKIVIYGELPGSTSIHLSMPDFDIETYTTVSVGLAEKKVNTPKASKPTGSEVDKGYQISLSTSTTGATIYYTLDGLDPSNTLYRIKYTEPITIQRNTMIKAIAVRNKMDDSDVATFVYYLDKKSLGDVNGDGAVDEEDIADIVEYIFGNPPEKFNENAADVNCDGKVNTADIVSIVNIIRGN